MNNLVPGTSYTFNVLATDQQGYLSAAVRAGHLHHRHARHSTCAVTYDVTQGWGNGYVANIAITDTGPNPINGWTLAFTLPGHDRVVQLRLERQLDRERANVQVTNLSWNGMLAANGGNSADIGFVGANNGAYPSPAAFTLNGTVCTTTYSS